MNTIRRLPVYLVIDCSESMAGPAFDAVQDGLQVLLDELRSDPNAIETVWLSVITFSERVKVVTALTDIAQFQKPELILGSGTSLGVTLELLTRRLKAEVVEQSSDRKGDWKPLVFLMTDGDPTDTWFSAADNFKNSITSRKANVIAVACGPDVNTSNLKRITNTVLAFNNPKQPSFKEFFKWISQSVQTTSTRLAHQSEATINLPALPPSMEMAAEGLQLPNQRYVFLVSRCSGSKGIYIARFEKPSEEILQQLRREGRLNLDCYLGVVSHPVTAFDFSEHAENSGLSISSDALLNPPACPYCRNESLASCNQCGRLFCVPGGGERQCPWCGTVALLTKPDRAFEIGRGLG